MLAILKRLFCLLISTGYHAENVFFVFFVFCFVLFCFHSIQSFIILINLNELQFRDVYQNKIRLWRHNYTALPKNLEKM